MYKPHNFVHTDHNITKVYIETSKSLVYDDKRKRFQRNDAQLEKEIEITGNLMKKGEKSKQNCDLAKLSPAIKIFHDF